MMLRWLSGICFWVFVAAAATAAASAWARTASLPGVAPEQGVQGVAVPPFNAVASMGTASSTAGVLALAGG
jgi:hypothetical protein